MKLIWPMFIFLILSSCVPSAGTNSVRSSTTTEEQTGGDDTNNVGNVGGPNTPTPSSVPNFTSFDNGGAINAFAEYSTDSQQVIYVRGAQVDSFLKNISLSIQCMVAEFPSNISKRYLVYALIPRDRYNNNNFNELEKNYSFYPNGDQNQIFCQKSSLTNALLNKIPEALIAYKAEDVCPNCFDSVFQSSNIKVYNTNGTVITQVNTSSLALRIQNKIFGTPIGTQCSQQSECIVEGFECCSVDGICADDLTIKNSVDQNSQEFLDVLRIVNTNPARRKDFTQFYNVCPVDIEIDNNIPSGQTSSDNLDSDAERLQHLSDLHECTTLIEGEMSHCTVKIKNASTLNIQTFETGNDDRNFETIYSGTKTLPKHSIVEIAYSNRTFFKDNTFLSTDVTIGSNNNLLGNDNLSDPGIIEMTPVKPAVDANDTIRIKYKIDGSCEEIAPGLALCEKHYIQGYNEGKVTDHFPASNNFILPRYANSNKTIQVLVDDILRFNGTHWIISKTNPTTISFTGDTQQVFEGQKVIIKYFVDTNSNMVLQSKADALNEIKTMCQCADTKCRLKPIVTEKLGKEVITDYGCLYPQPDLPPAPLLQVVLMSSKTVPLRLFNENAESKQNMGFDDVPQEGIAFQYEGRDVLKPNNIDKYIGFNEVYGSMTADNLSAKPAREVQVDQGKVYDIFVETGTFSTCFNCGTDYFSNVARLFPQNFTTVGGGLFPQKGITDRKNSTGYRADDLVFGRACWLPMTMIPWSHRDDTNRQNQRIDRLNTQHFQFANGYQRDWFGFDYGSVIASFDGTTWFSVGNQRRIQAKTNKLFVAVNAYFGDQTTESTFKVVVSEATTTAFSGSQITNDFLSDGAECQQEHVCETDIDCVTNLGWDYTCQEISLLKTKWPEYDSLGNEIPDHHIDVSLRALFNQSLGGNKRCVYRGKGAICHATLQNLNKDTLHNQDSSPGHQGCTDNNYCQEFTLGSAAKKFNSKIARFAASVNIQNNSTKVAESDLDTFGLGVRSMGRPYSFNGDSSIPPEVLNNLQSNNASALCIPGRNPTSSTMETANFTIPQDTEMGDKILNLGMTGNTPNAVNPQYLSSCSIIDPDSEKRLIFDTAFLTSGPDSQNVKDIASTQAFSTDHLSIFENIIGDEITTTLANRQLTAQTLGKNRCLRAPNSPCFTNFECAPNTYITNFVKRIAKGQSVINDFELKFWQEELICSQDKKVDDETYDHSDNRCCRETLKTIQIPTYNADLAGTSNDFDNKKIPATEIALSDETRYSRNAITHRETKSGKVPYLESPAIKVCDEADPDNCDSGTHPGQTLANSLQLKNQWKTFHLQASRTCCSKNWIRNFDSSNGGGHSWGPTKKQKINKANFKCYNWTETISSNPANVFSCDGSDDPEDPDCAVRSLFPSDYEPIMSVLEKLELTGIPQVQIELTEDSTSPTACSAYPEGHVTQSGVDPPLLPYVMPGLFNDNVSTNEFDRMTPEYSNPGENKHAYSVADMENFDPTIKKIFSEDTVSCCLPIGSELEAGEDKSLCCSGFLDETGTNPRCALPDYTNLSVFFNRYVSSEAAGLDDSLFNEDTGYFNNADSVIELACQVNACASNTIAFGVAVTPLAVENHVGTQKLFPRFIDSNQMPTEAEESISKLFEEGLRWNTQVYCFPGGDDSGGDNADPRLIIKSCIQ